MGSKVTSSVPGYAVRPAVPGDSAQLALLSGQLGYPTTAEELGPRLAGILSRADHAVLVACPLGGEETALGWIHIFVYPLLESEPLAGVGGLVVDEAHRGGGVGALLLDAAEQWARRHGCRAMQIYSNVVRERAHRFYRDHGYTVLKTSLALYKPL